MMLAASLAAPQRAVRAAVATTFVALLHLMGGVDAESGGVGRDELAAQASSPVYWRSLCPKLHIGEPHDVAFELSGLPGEVMESAELLGIDGYFLGHPHRREEEWRLGDNVTFGDMAACVVSMRQAGWPSVFVWVFDEFWLLVRRLRGILRALLGPDAVMLQPLWAYRVEAASSRSAASHEAETGGWFAHRDRPWLGTGNRPKSVPVYEGDTPWPPSLNVWLPLTHASPDNGCMYVYPKSTDSTIVDRLHRDRETMRMDAASVRAMPATPGQFMGWDGELLHWGSMAAEESLDCARISVNFEAARNYEIAAIVTHPEAAHFPLDLWPGFGFRLRAIDSTIKGFKHMNEHRVLPNRTRRFCLEDLHAVAASVPCGRDCDTLRGGLCGDASLPSDTPPQQCPRRRFE
uniref:Uncharacterized protein n=1 Tax=Bicosoecida sp. CB-2014 TaxID=1486930 RepID=A0A7S1CBJ4_9STRA|mmetsp:Transcript_20560/g.72629  ORF Transcript_20560/g.72629 Transcript_20560/m.72629 type:complete len:405 (+) Transcript_20560:1-1215(+)